MKKLLTLCILLIGFTALYSQNKSDSMIYTLVKQNAKFPGDINKWLAEHIVYPKQAQDSNIQGTVYISFVVEKDGSVSSIKILRGVNKYLDNESKRVIALMPKWSPGMMDGRPVRQLFNIPIHFILRDATPPPPPAPNQSTLKNPFK